MPIYAIEVAVVCDDLEEDGVPAIGVITEAVGIDPEIDTITLETGSDDAGHPVLIATLSIKPDPEESSDDSRD